MSAKADYISITRLRLKNYMTYPKFIKNVSPVLEQIQLHKACVHYETGTRFPYLDQYTVSAWLTYEDMKEFTLSGAHLNVMSMLKELSSEAEFVQYPYSEVPSMKEAIRYIRNQSSSLEK